MDKRSVWQLYTQSRVHRAMMTLFGKVPEDEDLIALDKQEPGIKRLLLHIADPQKHKNDFNRAGDDGHYGGKTGTKFETKFRKND